ncbi:hypothetical protein QJS10_CPA07g00412 [Acorus calamus]|uniref:Uncharacterized protein n=1 Tax=Acorus calamus TaxID=4465 RepID=A0AAV9EHJ0_ACOCL|nr:hypothetical protein QJS10_CPA07g00412 [Acorus calamus]
MLRDGVRKPYVPDFGSAFEHVCAHRGEGGDRGSGGGDEAQGGGDGAGADDASPVREHE